MTHPVVETVCDLTSCPEDRLSATGVLHTLQRAGPQVPDDVSVVGFDDTRLAGFSHIDRTDQAHRSISGRDTVVSPTLVAPSSSAPPPIRSDVRTGANA